jgi:hypothetical protein
MHFFWIRFENEQSREFPEKDAGQPREPAKIVNSNPDRDLAESLAALASLVLFPQPF